MTHLRDADGLRIGGEDPRYEDFVGEGIKVERLEPIGSSGARHEHLRQLWTLPTNIDEGQCVVSKVVGDFRQM